MYGDDDTDFVLFGGDDSPAYGAFDTFLEGITGNDPADDDFHGDADDPEQSNDPTDRSGYDGPHLESIGRLQQDDDQSLPWERGTGQPISGSAEQRARDAADTGNRHVGRVAAERAPSTGTGIGRNRSQPVANNILDAQQRIRAQSRLALDDDERLAAVKSYEAGEIKKPTRSYTKQHILAPPTFQQCEFEATLIGLKANTSGDWIVNLKVPPLDDEAVISLKHGYGLALEVHVTRKRFTSNGD